MRQIKFRGKDLKTKEWVYGYYAELHKPEFNGETPDIVTGYTTIHSIFNDGKGHRNSSYWNDVEEKTVGQFTGLQDKNDKEIYEGDVLKNNFSGLFGMVRWHDDGYFYIDCGYGRTPLNAGYRPLGEMLVLKLDDEKDVLFEVIGNIFDTPELLKGGEKWL